MRQQVNLLAPMFRKQRALFSAEVTILITGVVALALGLIYGAAAWRSASIANEHARLTEQRETLTRRITEFAAQLQAQKGTSLDAEIAALTTERDRKQQAVQALARSELGNTEGFSAHFSGLARQRLNGLWLTRVEVSGAQMSLDGITLSEELIPAYLQKLGTEPVFAGISFAHAVLQRQRDGGNQIRFELRSVPEAKRS